jgi:hypothetical protein
VDDVKFSTPEDATSIDAAAAPPAAGPAGPVIPTPGVSPLSACVVKVNNCLELPLEYWYSPTWVSITEAPTPKPITMRCSRLPWLMSVKAPSIINVLLSVTGVPRGRQAAFQPLDASLLATCKQMFWAVACANCACSAVWFSPS